MSGIYSMKQAAERIGVHKLTLYRWEREKKIAPARRYARKNERVYSDEDIAKIIEWKNATVDPSEGATA